MRESFVAAVTSQSLLKLPWRRQVHPGISAALRLVVVRQTRTQPANHTARETTKVEAAYKGQGRHSQCQYNKVKYLWAVVVYNIVSVWTKYKIIKYQILIKYKSP